MKYKAVHLISLLVYILIEVALPGFADTISIPEVLIQTSRENYYSNANAVYRLDSFQSHYYGQNSIAEVLQYFTPAQVSSYGSGGIATISLRGTADDQTSVFWNGLKLNSATLGTMDLSLIPVNTGSSVQIVTNASSAVLGSGNFGGAVLLNHQPVFKKQLDVSLRQDVMSFHNYKTGFSLHAGNLRVQFTSSAFYQSAKNNFPFFDNYKFDEPYVVNEHNATRQWAAIHQLNLKLKKAQQLDFGNYILQKRHEIPAMMGAYEQSHKYQDDFTVKSYMKYQKVFRSSQMYVRSGYIYDYMLYHDSIRKIYAPYSVHQLQNSVNYRHFFKRGVVLDAGMDYNLDIARVTEYQRITVRQHRGALFAGARYSIRNIKLSASMRQEVTSGKYIRPQFGVSLSYSDNKNIVNTSFSYADKFRYPDLNDLYWQPGGNKNLLPEHGYSVEYNLQLNPVKKTSRYKMVLGSSLYYSMIYNTIVWVPESSGLYSPQNIKKTRHYGIETKWENTVSWNSTNALRFSVNYNYNRAVIAEDASNADLNGNNIRYKPVHSIKSNLMFEDNYFNMGINYLYVGKRFSDDENSTAFQLPAYSLVDMFFAVKIPSKYIHTELVVKLNNMANVRYENLRSYAQPLRNYVFSLILTYKSIDQ
ncbi:MAG: TonB-dependent receptor [Sphingobacteriales bacterium]|jgi:vitamin B12 transporter|nr:TonB-dependent receptor [Sphingobacteriales bacterium]